MMFRPFSSLYWPLNVICLLPHVYKAHAQETLPNGFEYHVYETEPSMRAPTIDILNITSDLSRIQEGYLFIDPFVDDENIGLGPHIYDTYTGALVWSGLASCNPGTYATQNTHVCDYLGSIGDHICFTEAPGNAGLGRHRILNNHYEAVGHAQGFIGTRPFPANRHEFTMEPGGHTFLNIVYRNLHNHTEIDVHEHLREGCVQELDVASEEEVFRWCGHDHGVTGDGSWQPRPGPKSPMYWDYMHLNSMDKNEEGDYLVSGRYYDTVWKIAGVNAKEVHGIEPGTVMWKLGVSKSSDSGFTLDPPGSRFHHQHDARFISTGSETTVITLFDNHNDYPGEAFVPSAGKMFEVNNRTMTAKLLKAWPYPEEGRCRAMGSMRLQPNGNALIGWGERPFYTEFAADGEILLHASFKNNYTGLSYNYRVLKHPWVGKPKTKPKVIAYSFGCSNTPVLVYYSWNGATEIRTLKVSISSSASRPWVPLGMFPKAGFETKIELSPELISNFAGNTPRYVRVEAFDEQLNSWALADAETFIPSPGIHEQFGCDEQGCHKPKHFFYEASQNSVQECRPGSTSTWWTVVSVIAGTEALMHLHQLLWSVVDEAPLYLS